MNGFRLDSIMKARNINKQILPIHKYGQDSEFRGDSGLSKWVALFAENLRSYTADILNGDFSSFEKLDAQFRKNYYKNVDHRTVLTLRRQNETGKDSDILRQ